MEFKLPDAAGGDSHGRLVAAMRAGEIGGARRLDEKITPIHRVAPRYPQGLRIDGAPAGRAEVEFVIEREGRARLPRVVQATHEEFGGRRRRRWRSGCFARRGAEASRWT